MNIAYALAADHPDRVAALEVTEAVLPGVQQSPPLFVDSVTNTHLFHLMFNKLPTMNEQLVQGREDTNFSYIFDVEAGTKKLPPHAVRTYIDNLAFVPGALRGSFGFYRALDATTAQNAKRATTKLTIPVLAIGGVESLGTGTGNTMKLAARDVRTAVIPRCRPLGRRAGARSSCGRADRVPVPLPGGTRRRNRQGGFHLTGCRAASINANASLRSETSRPLVQQ